MICLIECQCINWEHERVNAGYISLVDKVYTNERKILYAQEGHIECVTRILDANNIKIESQKLCFPNDMKDSIHTKEIYVALIEDVVKTIPVTEDVHVIFLSANRGIMLANYELVLRYKNIKVTLILHAIAEQIFIPNSLVRQIYRKFVLNERDFRWVINQIPLDAAINFVIYSPIYKEVLSKYFNPEIVEKFFFLHHPYLIENKCFEEDIIEIDEINIGIVGAAINNTAYGIVKKIEKMSRLERIKFYLSHNKSIKFCKCKNVVVPEEKNNRNSLDIQKLIQTMDIILIPYGLCQYRLTASGVFWDSIYNIKPVLTLNSPYFVWYNKYNIGIVGQNINDLVKQVEIVDKNSIVLYQKNIQIMIKQVEKENMIFIRNVMF